MSPRASTVEVARELHPAYREYRRWRMSLFALAYGYLPAMWLVSTVAGRRDAVEWTAGVLWLASLAVCGARVRLFRCPRCGRRLSSLSAPGLTPGRWLLGLNPWAERCTSCGLSKWIAPGQRGSP